MIAVASPACGVDSDWHELFAPAPVLVSRKPVGGAPAVVVLGAG